MNPQHAKPSKGRRAYVAFIELFSRMAKKVSIQTVGVLEFRATGFAFDVPLVRMNELMLLQISSLAKLPPAFGARERPFAGMNSFVDGKRTSLSEHAATYVALVLDSGGSLVHH